MNHTTQKAIIISMLAALTIAAISVVGSVAVQAQRTVSGGLGLNVNLSPQGIQVGGAGLSISLSNSTGSSGTTGTTSPAG